MGEMTFADVFAVIMAIAFFAAAIGGWLATRPEQLDRIRRRSEGGNKP